MQFQFNAAGVPPSVPLEIIPADWYTLRITASELTQTKDKDGAYLNLTGEVLEGPFKGRKQFMRFNVQNTNAQAVDIAYRDLSALCHATGVIQLQDTQQLHNIPFEAKVTVRPAEGKYPESNDIKGYRACNSGQKPAGNGVGVAHTPSAPAAGAMTGNGAAPAAPPAGWGAGAAQAPAPAQTAPAAAPWQQAQPQAPVQGHPAQGAYQTQQPDPNTQAPAGFTPPWQQGGQAAAQQAYQQPPQQAPAPQGQPWQQPAQQAPQGAPQGAPWQQQAPQGAPQYQQPQGAPQGAPNGTPPWQR